MKNILFGVLFLVFSNWATSQTTTIYLIRHAEKIDHSKNPELSESGLIRANHWKDIFSEVPFDAIFSTDYIRTQKTAAPTALAQNKNVTTYDPKTLDVQKLVNDYAGKTILIVGHSNTTPELANKLVKQTLYTAIPDSTFGNLYIITLSDGNAYHQVLHSL